MPERELVDRHGFTMKSRSLTLLPIILQELGCYEVESLLTYFAPVL